MAPQNTQARRSPLSRCYLFVAAPHKPLPVQYASSLYLHALPDQQSLPLDVGYASNPTNTATPSRGNAVSTTYAHQSQHLSAPGFAAPQAMPQAPQVAAPASNAEYEVLRNQAHEAYRGGDFHRALQLCQSVSCKH